MQQKRIVIFHRRLRFGGAQRALVGFANGLVQSGHEVAFLAGSGSSDAARQMGLRPDVKLEILNASGALGQITTLASRLRIHRPDVLLARMDTTVIVCRIAAMVAGFRGKCFFGHGSPIVPARDRPGFKKVAQYIKNLLARWAFSTATCAFSATPGSAEELARFLGTPSSRVPVIPNVLSIAEFPPVSVADLERSQRPDAFLCVARLDANKRVGKVIEAFREASQSHPLATLLIAGVGEEEERLRQLVEQLDLAHRVEFLGFVGDIAAVYDRCKVFVLVSEVEQFGMVYLEAMRKGLEAIANGEANGPRFINTVCPSLVALTDVSPRVLAAAMTRAMAEWSPERGAGLSEESLRFSESAVVQEYLNPLLAEIS